MTSYKAKIDPRRQMFTRLIGDIHQQLQDALKQENEERGLTQADIANALGVNKSFISRRFSGQSNMTLETLSDLAWALNREVSLKIASAEELMGYTPNDIEGHIIERLAPVGKNRSHILRPGRDKVMSSR